MLGRMRNTGLTIFIDAHPDADLGYVISSLLYAHIDDDEPTGSGPSGEADTLVEAKQVAQKIAAAARKRGVADVEILVDGSELGAGLGGAHGKFHLYAEDGFESVHQTFAAAHQAAVRGAKRRGVTYYVVRADAHGMTGGGKGTRVATVDGRRGGLGGGLGATTTRPVSELLSEGFDAGNYANAYDSTDLDDFEDKLEGRAPAYVGGFVLGFYSSYAPHEINDDRYDDARRKYGRLARQHGFID